MTLPSEGSLLRVFYRREPSACRHAAIRVGRRITAVMAESWVVEVLDLKFTTECPPL
jgi:hypothetical protein